MSKNIREIRPVGGEKSMTFGSVERLQVVTMEWVLDDESGDDKDAELASVTRGTSEEDWISYCGQNWPGT